MSRKLTTKEFIYKYKKNINSTIEIIGEYNGWNKNILCKCLLCNMEYITTPSSIKQGCGHGICLGNIKITHDCFVEKLSSINNNISVIGKYDGNKTKILFKCLVCNHNWYATPNKILAGRGCPKCAIKARNESKIINYEEVVDKLNSIHSNIDIIGDYHGVSTKILCRCNICKHEWKANIRNLLKGHRCPECARMASMKSDEDFIKELHIINGFVKPLEKYKGAESKILVKCLRSWCGNIWYSNPHSLLRGHGCPKCNASLGELKILDYLSNNNIIYEWQKEYNNLLGINNGLLSYDFYLPLYNLLIEYQGEFHDGTAKQQTKEQFLYQQEHDRRKKKYAKSHNIKLFEIWYWNYNNIEKIMDNLLKEGEFVSK